MILFHEGLPGSGKSYEAVARVICKALKDGRPVDAYIEGLDLARIAEAAEVPLDQVEQLLIPMERGDVLTWYKVARRNALVVLDEAQNFWPTGRQRLDDAITQAVTEHRHLGQDILLMGQSHKDVHVLWRRRIDKLYVFTKADAIGLDQRYTVATLKATRPEKFERVSFSTQKYDPRWFGSYASVVDGDVQTENYKDDRANILKGKFFRLVVPATVVACIGGALVLYDFFNPDQVEPSAAAKPASPPASVAGAPPVAVSARRAPVQPSNFIAELHEKYRPRLAWHYAHAGKEEGLIEWWDDDQLRETLTFRQIRYLGADAFAVHGLARIGDRWVTAWPVPERRPQPAPKIEVPGL